MDSPFGRIRVVCDDDALVAIQLHSDRVQPDPEWQFAEDLDCEATRQLRDYFEGKRREFTMVLRMEGTPFQKKVWQALEEIPYGTTVAYSDIAKKIGKPNAVRAVGTANGQNPIPIVVPCHRVIGRDGKLRGYGGGIDLKQQLLEFEGAAPLQLGV